MSNFLCIRLYPVHIVDLKYDWFGIDIKEPLDLLLPFLQFSLLVALLIFFFQSSFNADFLVLNVRPFSACIFIASFSISFRLSFLLCSYHWSKIWLVWSHKLRDQSGYYFLFLSFSLLLGFFFSDIHLFLIF